MSEHSVEYTLSLKDMLTGKIKSAENATNALHSAASKTRSAVTGLLEGIGIGLAAFKGIELVKESHEQFEKLEFSMSQVEAGLESTGHAAGLTFEELKQGAYDTAHAFKFTQAEVMGMQSILLTFPGITKQAFGDTSTIIEDMSTRLGQDLKSTAIQVGKAMQDPIQGVTALRRVGVNFNQTQTELIKKMAETGHSAQAQAYILNELKTEFEGSADAAAKADKGFRLHKTMEEFRLTIGGVADKIEGKLMPALLMVANGLKNTIGWMQKHKEIAIAVASGIGIIVIALGIYEGVLLAASIKTKLLTVAQWALNSAMLASPITWIVLGLAALTAGVVYCYNHFAKFRAVLFGVWEFIKEFGRIAIDVFLGLGKIIIGVLTFSPSKIIEGGKQAVSAISEAGTRLGGAFHKGFSEGMADFAKDHLEEKHTATPKTLLKGKPGAPGADGKGETSKATGNKSNIINIKIDSLVKSFTVTTKNISEGAARVKEIITQTMLSAVNDSQIVAGQ
jgi:hypothetical protein